MTLAWILCLIGGTGLAQDPFQVAPGAYKLQFENDWVKVARVHYAPRERLPAHDHPTAGTVFVYLNDGGPVRFEHVFPGHQPFPLVRPATRAGGFRLAQAVSEHHEVENLSDLPSDFLRVELKTQAIDVEKFQGRFAPESMEDGVEKVAFENGQVRILRTACPARKSCEVAGTPNLPALLIAFSPVQAIVTQKDGPAASVDMALGQTQWLEPGQKATLRNGRNETVQQLRIEFKTTPIKTARGIQKDE